MSNPTELPVKTWEDRAYAELGHFYTRYKPDSYMQAEIDDLRAVVARRAQPEGEAPQAAMVLDANRYVYLASTADWSEIEDLLRRSDAESAMELKRDLDKLIDTRLKGANTLPLYVAPAASLSPLCGAQHAESGAAAIPTWQERAQELGFSGRRQGYPDTDEQEELKAAEIADLRAALAAQQAAAPGALDAEEMTRLRRLMDALGHADAFDQTNDYARGILFTVLGQAAGKLERAAQLDGGQEGSESNG